MTSRKKFILAGVAAAAVGLTAAGAFAERGHHWKGPHKGHHFGHKHGGSMGFLNRAFAGGHMFCRGNSAEFADIMLVKMEHRLKITDDQKDAFETFKGATRTAVAKLSEDCPERPHRGAKTDGDKKDEEKEAKKRLTPIERLAERQERLESSLEALKAYRPAAEAFYAELTDDQKEKLTERRGKRHGWWRGRHGGDRWEHRRGTRHERGEHRRDRDGGNDNGGEADNAPAQHDTD